MVCIVALGLWILVVIAGRLATQSKPALQFRPVDDSRPDRQGPPTYVTSYIANYFFGSAFVAGIIVGAALTIGIVTVLVGFLILVLLAARFASNN